MNSREYTFHSLFGSSFDFDGKEVSLNTIEIPIIQRDYAQGRETDSVRRIRERFLEALFQSITTNQHRTLDFVYGDVSKDGVLTPLDGQQRLTTLFLLHWYIAKVENIDVDEYDFLRNFSYSIRFSSRDFCQELVTYNPDFSKEVLSDCIKDQAWYPYEWKNDPTIHSMLVMIDAIHGKFYGQKDLWKSLVIGKNITFYFLPLTEMGLTDDLYIKMNSRGKPLTPFEHFKAEFEETIKHLPGEISNEINHNLDVEWAAIFFPFRGDNNVIDDEFMRYFRFVSDSISYQSGMVLERDEFKLAELLYGKDHEKAIENVEYLRRSFNCWRNLEIKDFFNKFFSKNNYEEAKVQLYQDDLNIFKECCDYYGEYSGRNRRFPLNKILLLFSINTYLQSKDKVSEQMFRRRIRIIRNLIWNSNDEIRDERMHTLLSECKTITLSGEIPVFEKGDAGFNVRQKEEERHKIEWLKSNSEMEKALFHLEDHPLLKGCIAIIGLDNKNNFNKFRLLFNNCSKDSINRALLSVGDYSQLISWRHQVGAQNNESVWFDLFHPSKQRQHFDKTKETLNLLLNMLTEAAINDESLGLLINMFLDNPNTQKDWRYYLIKYDQMRSGNFGMYYWQNDAERLKERYEIIMMNTEKSIGGRNWNIFLHTLFHLPEFAGKLSLGEYAYQGDKLNVVNLAIEIECLNDKYVITQNGNHVEYEIQQSNGLDVEDRIEKGKQIIRDLL